MRVCYVRLEGCACATLRRTRLIVDKEGSAMVMNVAFGAMESRNQKTTARSVGYVCLSPEKIERRCTGDLNV